VYLWSKGLKLDKFSGHFNNLKVVYSKKVFSGANQGPARTIPQVPDRILDAPELLDDYCK
jgi:cell division cycle protein 20 (cofactor of APC complex)